VKKKKRLSKNKNKKQTKNKRTPIKHYSKHELSWYIVGFFIALLLLFSYLDKKEMFKIHPLVVFFFVFLISIYIIMKSAGFAIEAISHYSKQTGINDFVIGFIVVAIATSLPELSTAYFASSIGKGGYVLGDVISANIINITLVLGIIAWLSGGIKIKRGIIGKTFFEEIAILLLPLILGIDGVFSSIDGIILILGFILYLIILIKQQGSLGRLKKNVEIKYIWKDIFIFGGTIAAILLSTKILVQSLNVVSDLLKVPNVIVGVLFLGIATTIPELTVGIKSVLKGMQNISIGNVFGSLIVNFSLVLGIAALINPINMSGISYMSFIIGCVVFLISIFLVSKFIKELILTKTEGKVLVGVTIVFFIIQIVLAVLRG